MASNLVLTKQESSGTVTFYRNKQAAIDAGANMVWKTVAVHRASPWEIVEYTGHSTIDAKFMGGKTREWTIQGFVFDAAASEATMLSAMNSILALNSTKERYTASGPISHAVSKGLIVTEVASEPYGDGTGPHWEFFVVLRDLGV